MTQEALKVVMDALDDLLYWDNGKPEYDEARKALQVGKQALAQTQEPVAVYGYCPECGAKGVMRERRPNGDDKCANGHTYPSSTSTSPQRTWVGLTDEERIEIDHFALSRVQAVQMTEAKLKEKNT
jgi:hypothetical protein